MIKIIVISLMMLTGCCSFTPGPSTTSEIEDKDCLTKPGGQHGYCDARHHNRDPRK